MKKIVFQICISVGYIGFPIFTMQEFGKGKELNNEQLQITMPDENILKNRLELHWSDFVKKTNFIKQVANKTLEPACLASLLDESIKEYCKKEPEPIQITMQCARQKILEACLRDHPTILDSLKEK